MRRPIAIVALAVCLAAPALAGPAPGEKAPPAADAKAAEPAAKKPAGTPAKGPEAAAEPALNPAQKRILEQTDKLFGHLKTLFGLLGQNKQDCPAAIRAAEGFVEELGPEIRKIAAELQQAEAGLSQAEKESITRTVQARAESLMTSMQGDLMAFVQACPNETAKMGELLSRLLQPTAGAEAQ